MKLNDTWYGILKWMSLIFFDALGILYKTLASIWGWPFGQEVLTTCTAASLFVGSLIGVSSAEYYEDEIYY